MNQSLSYAHLRRPSGDGPPQTRPSTWTAQSEPEPDPVPDPLERRKAWRRRLFRLALVAVPVLLSTVLGGLVYETSAAGFDFEDAERTLRDLKQVDAQWNVDLLGVAAGMSSDYDDITKPRQIVASLNESVRLTATTLDKQVPNAALFGMFNTYDAAMKKKMDLIERIKSQHALLINSARFLPVANVELQQAAQTSDLSALESARLATRTNALLADTMSFMLIPDRELGDRIQNSIEQLMLELRQLPQSLRSRLETVTSHARVMLSQRRTGIQLMEEVRALPISVAIDGMNDRYVNAHQTLLDRQNRYKMLLAAYCACLLVLLAITGRSMYRAYRALSESNRTLKSANDESQILIIQSAKMSAIGQMVAGVAHEINTPLAYVKATFEVLREQLTLAQSQALDDASFGRQLVSSGGIDPGPALSESHGSEGSGHALIDDLTILLEDGLHGIQQIARLVMTLKNFSRLDKAKRADYSVHDGLDSTLEIARHMLKNSVEIKKDYKAVKQINCSPSQINQVFLNIITNAVQAMPKGCDKGLITLSTMQHDADTVRIDIKDNGTGIPPDILPKIFDPFFTTKPVGEGTGAGLSICYRIVQNHRGQILVDSEPGVGTTFSILLPVRDASASVDKPKMFAHA